MAERLSLVIASHRRGARIDRTLASVADQTCQPDEIVVLNDGGFDETRTFVSEHYPHVRVVDADGGSAGAARNLGARAATGTLIMFLDDDDVLHPHAVETLMTELAAFPEAAAAFADHTFRDHTTGTYVANHHQAVPAFGRLAAAAPIRSSALGRLYDRTLYYPMLHGGLLQQPWLVRRAVFLELGGFDTAFRSNEDWDLFLRLVHDHRVCLTDIVISDHIVEAGRTHVSRSASLDHTSRDIIVKHVRLARGAADAKALRILLPRLANHYKTEGDRMAPSERYRAWRAYLRAAKTWPFDHVVLARALVLWPLDLIRRQWRGEKPWDSPPMV